MKKIDHQHKNVCEFHYTAISNRVSERAYELFFSYIHTSEKGIYACTFAIKCSHTIYKQTREWLKCNLEQIAEAPARKIAFQLSYTRMDISQERTSEWASEREWETYSRRMSINRMKHAWLWRRKIVWQSHALGKSIHQ